MTFDEWWENNASAMRPMPHEDVEEFAHRMTALAWINGENTERAACANVVESFGKYESDVAEAIRARGQA